MTTMRSACLALPSYRPTVLPSYRLTVLPSYRLTVSCLMPKNPWTIVVTGASSGIGKALSTIAARDGATVIMVSHHRGRAEAALSAVRRVATTDVHLELANLGSLAEVRALGTRLRSEFGVIDALVNNAGVLRSRMVHSADGFELTMAVNHLAHFLLSHMLVESLAAARGRIVNVSSEAHASGDLKRAPFEDILRGQAWKGMMKAYSDSKLANVLFTFEWGRRQDGTGVVANTLHPGVLRTRIWNQNLHPLSLFMQPFRPFFASPASGAEAVLRLARPGLADDGGMYFDKRTPTRGNRTGVRRAAGRGGVGGESEGRGAVTRTTRGPILSLNRVRHRREREVPDLEWRNHDRVRQSGRFTG